MIVYFKEKSKILRSVLLGSIGTGVLYMFWLWTHLLIQDIQTIQIIHKKDSKTSQTSPLNPEKSEISDIEPQSQYLFVASSRGKYFYPKECSRAKALSIKNMLYFKDKMSAEAQGYVQYSGC